MASVSSPAILALLVILSVSIGQLAIATIPDGFTIADAPESTIAQAPDVGDAGAPAPGPEGDYAGAPAPGPGGEYTMSYNLESSSMAATSTFGAAEKSKDAVYLGTSMAFTANKIEMFNKNVLEARLKDPTIDDETKQCLGVCIEVYSSAVDALQKGMEDVHSHDFPKANFDMSAFVNNIDTCSECAKKLSEPELEKFEEWLKGITDDCFNRIAKYSTFSINSLV